MGKDETAISWYVVAFIDLLGQQEELRSLTKLPDEADAEETKAFVEVVKKTAGRVAGFKKIFLEFFEGFNTEDIFKDPRVIAMNPEVNKDHYKCNDVKIQQFSDCVIAYSSLCDEAYKSPTQGIYVILTAIANIFLLFLAKGIPIRGGIDIGIGVEISENNFYGPGLARAYTMESKVTQYPRVVLGDELIKYLDLREAYDGNDPVGVYNKHLAGLCKKLVCLDDDGYPIVDYLSNEMMECLKTMERLPLVDGAFNFVLEQSKTWKKHKDGKKAFRYTLLRNYFEERLGK